MILSELRTYSRNVLDEATAKLYSDTEIDAWINLAQRDIAAKTGCIEVISTLTTTIGSRQVAFVGDKVNAVELYVGGLHNFIPGTGIQWEDTVDAVWQDLSEAVWTDTIKDLWVPYPALANLHVTPQHLGHIALRGVTTPQYWFQWDNNIIIEPVPDDVYTLNAYISQSPLIDLLSASSSSTLPLVFQDAIPLYVSIMGYLKARRYGDATAKYGEYIFSLQNLVDRHIRRKAARLVDVRLPDVNRVKK